MAAAPSEIRAALMLVTAAGVADVEGLFGQLDGSPEQVRAALLEGVPAVVDYYTVGSAALAVDWYEDVREEASPRKRFAAEPVIPDRFEKIRNMVAWASDPLFATEPDRSQVTLRLLPEVQKEIALPSRETITANTKRDPAAVGWRRVTSGSGCKFCRLLSERGAVYRQETARFASHSNCHCHAAPVFDGQDGDEANVLQYVASKRRRTEADRQRLRDYLAQMPD